MPLPSRKNDGSSSSMTPEMTNLEAFVADKGVLYARIIVKEENNVDNIPIHVFNLHTNSDTNGDYHSVRMDQFQIVRNFIDNMQLPSSELVLIGGDFNEDRDCRVNRCEGEAKCQNQQYYKEMIEVLNVSPINVTSSNTYTYNTEDNQLLKGLYQDTDCDYYQYTLDYIFYSLGHWIPKEEKEEMSLSECRVLNPRVESEDDVGVDLSDHLPVSCRLEGIVGMNDG